jgi:hypothetical protein
MTRSAPAEPAQPTAIASALGGTGLIAGSALAAPAMGGSALGGASLGAPGRPMLAPPVPVASAAAATLNGQRPPVPAR